MIYSLNETENLAKKAARGAGYSWGMAEEAGRAVRWLIALGLPADKAFADLISSPEWTDPQENRPLKTGREFRSATGRLCPLMSGAALCDDAHVVARVEAAKLIAVRQPLLLLPFAGQAAHVIGRSILVSWNDARVIVDGNELNVDQGEQALMPDRAVDVTLSISEVMGASRKQISRAALDKKSHAVLAKFAHRTYAPATEESRKRGAGAAASDND